MKHKILFGLCLLVGLLFVNAGLDKFLHYMPMPADMPAKMVQAMAAFATIGWLMPLVGAAELAGGALLIFKRTRALGAIVLVPILAGIWLANLTTSPGALPIVATITGVVGWAIADNWHKYRPMLQA